MDEAENPTPLVVYGSRPSSGRTHAAEAQVLEWEALANQQAEERQYLQELAGVNDLGQADSLQIVVNTTSSTVSHLGSLMPCLTELNVTGSLIESVRDLGTGFRQLQVLWLARCGLKALDGIAALPALKELYAAYNDVSDLQALDSCMDLEVLDLEGNCIPDVDTVVVLQWCPQLTALTLAGNPVAFTGGYRQAVIAAVPSLKTLDDIDTSCSTDDAGLASGSDTIADAEVLAGLSQAPSLAAAGQPTSAGSRKMAASKNANEPVHASAMSSGRAGPQELAFVAQGIKHARVGVDSQEFKEIEMSLLLAMADGGLLSPNTRPSTTGAINPSGAACWLRTLRSSVQGPLAALRSSTSATALHGACSQSHSLSRSASQASSSALQSPCASRPGSASQPASSTYATHQQTQHQQHFPSEAHAAPSFTRSASSASASGVPPRPRSGRPGSGSSQLDLMHGPGQGPGNFVRPSTASSSRPFSARPGTASGVPGSRIGTSASTGSGSSISGLYWAKNRISNPDGQASASGRESSSAAGGQRASGPGEGEGEDAIVGSQLTRGTRSGFGGSLAKDLRKWKQGGGAAVAGMSAAGTGDGGGPAGLGAVGSRPLRAFTLLASDAAADDSQHGSSHDRSHNAPEGKAKSSHSHSQAEAGKIGLQHLDYGALLEELRQWKVDTADRVLLEDPDTAVGGWGEGGDEELDVGPMAGGTQADILELDPTHSVDPLLHEHVNSAHSGSGSSEQSAASTSATTIAAASTSTASLTPAAARQLPMEHPAHAAVQGAVAAGVGGLAMPGAPRGGRKTMLSKVVRDVSSSFDQSMDTLSLSDPSANGRLGPSAPCQQGAAAGSNSLAVSAGRPPLAPGSQGLRQQPSFTDGMTRGSGRPNTAGSSVSTASSGGTGSEHCMLGSGAGRYAVTSVVGEVDVRSANPRPRARQAINDDDDV